jgi:hypothetical protein
MVRMTLGGAAIQRMLAENPSMKDAKISQIAEDLATTAIAAKAAPVPSQPNKKNKKLTAAQRKKIQGAVQILMPTFKPGGRLTRPPRSSLLNRMLARAK